MHWSFSLSWFIGGLALIVAGILITYYYKPISDHLAHGINSYDRVKLAGIIVVIIGFILMTNIHTLILNTLVNLIFKR